MKKRNLNNIDTIIVHCSATPPDMRVGADRIRQWHKERGWDDIGYHYVITRAGEIEQGRALEYVGAHTKGHNRRSIGICLIGGLDQESRKNPEANFTLEQYKALKEKVTRIDNMLGRKLSVHGHKEFANKACPCFNVRELLPELSA